MNLSKEANFLGIFMEIFGNFLAYFWAPPPPGAPGGGPWGTHWAPPMGAHAAAESRAVGAGGGRRGRAARPGSL